MAAWPRRAPPRAAGSGAATCCTTSWTRAPACPPNPSGVPSRSPRGAAPTPTRRARPRSSAAAGRWAGWRSSACRPGWSTRPAWCSPWPAGRMSQKQPSQKGGRDEQHRVLVRQPRDGDRRAAAADGRPSPRHPGQPAGPAARPAEVRGDRYPPEPVPAVGGVHRRARADGGARHIRQHPAGRRDRPVRLGLRAAVAGPGRDLAGPDARDDRDQPAPRPDEPPAVAGHSPARLPELADRVRAQHRLEQGPAAGLDARYGDRLRAYHRGGGNLAAGSRGTAGAQGRTGRRGVRTAHRVGGQNGPTEPPGGVAMTTAVNESAPGGAARQAAGLPRLLPATPEDLQAHLARYGPTPYRGRPGVLIDEIETSGLTGRGGAAFPVYRKLAVVARARGTRKVIVANGAESEPASRKDELLLRLAPNLVLDGLQLAAEAIGATEAHLYLHSAPSPEIQRAQDLRAGRGVQVQVRLGGADRLGGQLQPVEHEVRREPQQQFVLAAGRLALRAVGDDHLPGAAGAGHHGQLPVHREGRAAPAGQAGRLDFVDQHAGAPPVRGGAVPGQVGLEVFLGCRQQAGQPGSLPGCPAWRRFIHGGGHRDTAWRFRRAVLAADAVCCANTAATRPALGTCRAA